MKKIISICSILVLLISALESKAEVIKAGVIESTPVPIVAEWHIGPETQIGEHFSARIIEDFVDGSGAVIIPKDSHVVGTVVDIQNARSFHRRPEVDIQFEKIIFPDNVTTISIQADGSLYYKEINSVGERAKQIGQTVGEMAMSTGIGAIAGAILGFKFGGLIGAGSSAGESLMIGAGVGAGISLVSFIAKKGEPLAVYPGMPLTLNMISLEEQNYKQQKMPELESGIKAEVLERKNDSLKVKITNETEQNISLANLQVVDALGYIVKPSKEHHFYSQKQIPAKSELEYEFVLPERKKQSQEWLVLTDSFQKQEYFKVEL